MNTARQIGREAEKTLQKGLDLGLAIVIVLQNILYLRQISICTERESYTATPSLRLRSDKHSTFNCFFDKHLASIMFYKRARAFKKHQ